MTGTNENNVPETTIDDLHHNLEQQQQELRDREQRFRAILENTNEIIYTLSLEGIFTYISPAWTKLLGYSVESAMGQSFTEYVHPDDVDNCTTFFQQIIKRRESQQGLEFRARHADGSWRLYSTNAGGVIDENNRITYFVGLAQDITARKALEAERNRIYETSIDLIGTARLSDARFRELNPAWEKVLGWTIDELMAKPSTEFIHPDDRERTEQEITEQLSTGQSILSFENRYLHKDGTYRWLAWNSWPDPEADVSYFIARDVTEQKKAAAMLAKQAQEMQTVAEISTIIASTLDMDQLLDTVTDLTKERFDLYHAHIYLLDNAGKKLHLVAGAGDVGREMVQEGRFIDLEQQSLVAQVARSRQAVIVNDVRDNPDFLPHPLLPDTRAEMAVPLIVGDTLWGVLDVQADQADYFTEDDRRVQTTLAAQIAVALQNADSFARSEETRQEMDMLTRRLTRQGWEEFLQTTEATDLRYAYDLKQLFTPENGRSADSSDTPALQQPLVIQGSEIGQLWLDDPQALTEEAGDIVNAVAERLALHIENLRLTTQTEVALSETEALYQASARLNAVQTYDDVLDVLRQYTIAGQQVDLVSLNMFDHAWTDQRQPDWINVIAYWSSQPISAEREMTAFRLADYPAASVLLDPDKPTIVLDAKTDDRLDDTTRALFVRGFKASSILVVPLITGGRWRGYISAFYGQPMTFAESEIKRLTLLSSQAAVAIQSLQLLRQTEQQLTNLTSIQRTTASLSGALSFDEAINLFLEQVCQAVAADSVDMYDLDGHVVNRIGVYPMHPDKPVAFACTLEEQTMMRRAVEAREPVTLVINDQAEDEALRQSFADAGIKTNVTLPLIGRTGIFGVLSVNREQELRQFDEQDLNLLQTLSDQAMIAFERVQLLEEATQRAKYEQRLREITTQVRGSIDADTIMRTAVQEVGRVLGRRTFIYLGQDAGNGREQSEVQAQITE